MATQSLQCMRCRSPFSVTHGHVNGPMSCPGCGLPLEVYVYPAFFKRKDHSDSGERLVVEDEAGCFHHPGKKAETVCSRCGRFLCALCATEWDNRPICLNCLSQAHTQGQETQLQRSRVLYDDIALALAVIPILAWPLTIITAPIALFIVLVHWRKGPTSIIKRSRIRYVLAFILALAQTLGWGALLLNVFRNSV